MFEHAARRLSSNELGGCRSALVPIFTRRFSCINPLAINQKTLAKPNRRKVSDHWRAQRLDTEESWTLKLRLKDEFSQLRQVKSALRIAGDADLSASVRNYIEQAARLTNCENVHICDGSKEEKDWLLRLMVANRMIKPLEKLENCWLARTDPRDVARVESRTFICTRNKHDVIPRGAQQQGSLGNWMHVDELDQRIRKLMSNCMAGRTMFVIPFSMGPIGSPLSKFGIQLTDSPYVVSSMMIMTRVSRKILRLIKDECDESYVKCLHSVGCPLPLVRPLVNNWPCDPENTIISHIPERNEIISYGSGYGGNSLLGKKCFALRLGSIMGQKEGWLAEHMLILGVTNPEGVKRYMAAAFPSACGKTNLAMMTPSLPGYKIECVGDDIAWMRFDESGVLRAINPEAGFFGVAPGTNQTSNPNAMKSIKRNTIFTNVAETLEGDIYWEGLEHELRKSSAGIIDWRGQKWFPDSGQKSAHPNSRFCCPASQCPIIDPEWESPIGVPISAIIFGGRRPEGVPLVYESFDWSHGVYVGASMRSESTAAAEHQGKSIMHDPFAMRPFFGYNFGSYLKHWLSFGKRPELKLPKIFHVNWFRKDPSSGEFLWPGFGENSRVLDWICRRIDGEQCAKRTPIGLIPTEGSLKLDGLKGSEVKLDQLFHISKQFWLDEQESCERYLRENVGLDLPSEIETESDKLKARLESTSDW